MNVKKSALEGHERNSMIPNYLLCHVQCCMVGCSNGNSSTLMTNDPICDFGDAKVTCHFFSW
jgi:hypothetical protein